MDRSPRCSARTAPARPPPSARSPAWCVPTPGASTWTASMWPRSRSPRAPGSAWFPNTSASTITSPFANISNTAPICRASPPGCGPRGSRRLLDQLGLVPLASRLAGSLSLGERRRLALARALVHEPANLVFDEPTNGLDVMSAREVRREIARLAASGCAILVSTHVMPEVAALCNRVVVMAAGAVIATGTPGELLQQTRLRDARRRVRADDRIGRGAELMGAMADRAKGMAGDGPRPPIAVLRAVLRRVGAAGDGHRPARHGQAPGRVGRDRDRRTGRRRRRRPWRRFSRRATCRSSRSSATRRRPFAIGACPRC